MKQPTPMEEKLQFSPRFLVASTSELRVQNVSKDAVLYRAHFSAQCILRFDEFPPRLIQPGNSDIIQFSQDSSVSIQARSSLIIEFCVILSQTLQYSYKLDDLFNNLQKHQVVIVYKPPLARVSTYDVQQSVDQFFSTNLSRGNFFNNSHNQKTPQFSGQHESGIPINPVSKQQNETQHLELLALGQLSNFSSDNNDGFPSPVTNSGTGESQKHSFQTLDARISTEMDAATGKPRPSNLIQAIQDLETKIEVVEQRAQLVGRSQIYKWDVIMILSLLLLVILK